MLITNYMTFHPDNRDDSNALREDVTETPDLNHDYASFRLTPVFLLFLWCILNTKLTEGE